MIRKAVLATFVVVLALALPAQAHESDDKAFPDTIELPDGFQPEGIAIAPDGWFYVGSIPTGDIYEGDLRSGEGEVLVDAEDGRAAIGLAEDRGLLYVAGGPTGQAFVYDTGTGAQVASYQLRDGDTFVNDVTVTRTAAFFTDSVNPVVYRVPLDPYGFPGDQDDVTTLPLTGALTYEEGFNANGIAATPSGRTLVVVQSNTGRLFTVDADSGETSAIELGDDDVRNGDGILLDGKTLYVVQNQLNQIAVVDLAADLSAGTVEDVITDDDFDVPTTVAAFDGRLYAVNARFDTPPEPDTSYAVVQVDKP